MVKEGVAIIREVLEDEFTMIDIASVTVTEDFNEGLTSIECVTTSSADVDGSASNSTFSGKGVGLIDALFNAFFDQYADQYPSLSTIQFSQFSITANLDTKKGYSGSDAQITVSVDVKNSKDKQFSFTSTSRSTLQSAIQSIVQTIEYFINSEKAFISMYKALEDAKSRNRPDLIQRYTSMMSELVKNASYSELLS